MPRTQKARHLKTLLAILLTTALLQGGEGDNLYSDLTNPEKGIVRATIYKIAKSKDKDAPAKLIKFYRTGETYDWWGFHIKNTVLIELNNLAINDITTDEALDFAFEELQHQNNVLFESALRLIVTLGRKDPEATGKRLLEKASENKNDDRSYQFVGALGDLKYAPAVSYVVKVHQRMLSLKKDTNRYAIAQALANMGTADGIDTLMDIYLATQPLSKTTCDYGEPIVPCLSALRKTSGKDFGDDRDKWKAWHESFKKQK